MGDTGTYGGGLGKILEMYEERDRRGGYWDVRVEELARYWKCMRTVIGGVILGFTGGRLVKILEMYEKRNWRGEIGMYGGRTWQDIGDL